MQKGWPSKGKGKSSGQARNNRYYGWNERDYYDDQEQYYDYHDGRTPLVSASELNKLKTEQQKKDATIKNMTQEIERLRNELQQHRIGASSGSSSDSDLGERDKGGPALLSSLLEQSVTGLRLINDHLVIGLGCNRYQQIWLCAHRSKISTNEKPENGIALTYTGIVDYGLYMIECECDGQVDEIGEQRGTVEKLKLLCSDVHCRFSISHVRSEGSQIPMHYQAFGKLHFFTNFDNDVLSVAGVVTRKPPDAEDSENFPDQGTDELVTGIQIVCFLGLNIDDVPYAMKELDIGPVDSPNLFGGIVWGCISQKGARLLRFRRDPRISALLNPDP
jgi:hypothetical protein